MAERDPDHETRERIEDDSNRLLAAVDEIRRLESEKRRVPMSTPEFHARAEAIERKSRTVFGLARDEREEGDRLTETQEESIDDEAASQQGELAERTR